MDKGKLGLGLCILAGLVFLGAMLPKAANDFKRYERTVNVKGLCEKEVEADKVIWPLVIKIGGDNIGSVYQDLDDKVSKIKTFLSDGGVTESEMSIGAATVSDRNTEDYNNQRTYRYLVKSVITVCSTEVDKVRALMQKQNELLSEGVTLEAENWENQTRFSYESLNDIKPEMIEEATKNARQVAQKFAIDSESRLGKIKNASQGTFSIEDRDSNTPWIKKVRVVTNITYYLKK